VLRDPTLEHPRCVFQLLKTHYSRYTPEVVARIAGCSVEDPSAAEASCAPYAPPSGASPASPARTAARPRQISFSPTRPNRWLTYAWMSARAAVNT
jgi:anaerobic selenocysteine-containing dehydrogenase